MSSVNAQESTLSVFMRENRKKLGLFQTELAAQLGVSVMAAKQWEQGRAIPADKNLIRLARFFGVTADTLDKAENSENPFRRLRLRAGLTLDEAGQEIGISTTAVFSWERGGTKPIRLSSYRRIAEVYGCDAEALPGYAHRLSLDREEQPPLVSVLRERRIARGMTQTELGTAIGVPYKSILHWERGQRAPRAIPLRRLETFFQCSAAELGFSSARKIISPLRERRLTAGLTQEAVAQAVGATNGTIVTAWEVGRQTPSKKYLVRLSALFHCTFHELGFPEREPIFTEAERNALVEESLPLIHWVIKKNLTLVIATHMEWENLFQDMAESLVRAVNTYNPEKSALTTHVVNAVQWELQHSAARANAHGIHGAPRDLYPRFSSIEAMTEAGFQFVAR